MKHLSALLAFLCLIGLTACEKSLLAETDSNSKETTAPKEDKDSSTDKDTSTGQDGTTSKGDDQSSSSGDQSSSSGDDQSGSSEGGTGDTGSDTGTIGGDTGGGYDIEYPDDGTSGSTQTGGIIDGNDPSEKGEGGEVSSSSTDITVQGVRAYTVSDFVAGKGSGPIWVVGYIVGECRQNIKYANFGPEFNYNTAILLADDPNERDTSKMMSVQLTGSRQEKYGLKSHPENQGSKLLAIKGDRKTYLGIWGMKSENTGIASIGWLEDYPK